MEICNADNTDCDCTDDTVNAKQFGQCASESVCRVYCQIKKYPTGECTGETGWDCVCKGERKTAEEDEATAASADIEDDGEEGEGGFVFDARRRRRSTLFGF